MKRLSVALAVAALGTVAGLAATHRAGAAAHPVRTASRGALEGAAARPAVPPDGGFFAQDGIQSPRFAPDPGSSAAAPLPAPPPVVSSSGS